MPGDSATLQENALALARLAVEMQELCATLTAPDGSPVVMRIGLHCGPVVGGVVGGNSAPPLMSPYLAPITFLNASAHRPALPLLSHRSNAASPPHPPISRSHALSVIRYHLFGSTMDAVSQVPVGREGGADA